MEAEPLVSVVTPFYNTRDFLAECIESVLRQTYRNWEYVLVDNHSTDGSSEIAQSYAARFPALRLIRTESFLTQNENYNFALTRISPSGKYCKMVQADDWLFPDCIRSMVQVAEAHPSVGIVASYELEGNQVSLDGLPYPSHALSGRDACRRYFLDRLYLFGTPTSLLFRSELVRSRRPFFDPARSPFDDADACFSLLKTADFGFVHQVLTFSRRDNESTLSRLRPFYFWRFTYLADVVVHGKDFLSATEYRQCLASAEHEYYLLLGRAALTLAGKKFWEFHRARLASIDYALDRKRLAKWILLALFDYLGNPKRTVEDLWRGARRRKPLARVRRPLSLGGATSSKSHSDPG